MMTKQHIIGASLLAMMAAGQAGAVIEPDGCFEADGTTYSQVYSYADGISVGLANPGNGLWDFYPVLQSCTSGQQIRITVPDEFGFEMDVLDELHLIATSTETHTMQGIASRFADRGFPVQTLTGIRPTCLCDFRIE